MSLTKLSLVMNNSIIPGQGKFGKWKNRLPFLQCTLSPTAWADILDSLAYQKIFNVQYLDLFCFAGPLIV